MVGYILHFNCMEKFEKILIWLGVILVAVAFVLAFEMSKVFFILVCVTNIATCIGVEAFSEESCYPLAFFWGALAAFIMVLLAYTNAHIALTFIPSAIVAGCTSASATRNSMNNWLGIVFAVLVFFLFWLCNINLMVIMLAN